MAYKVVVGQKPDRFATIQKHVDPSAFALTTDSLATLDFSGFDAVLPVWADHQRDLTRRIEAGERIPALLPSAEAFELCEDKRKLNRRLIDAGFRANIPKMLNKEKPKLPFILKKRRAAGGINTEVIHTAEERAAAADRIASGAFILQAYIPGDIEYATHILLKDGRIRYQITAEYHMPKAPYVKGVHTPPEHTVWIDQSPHLPLLLDMLLAAGFTDGTCCIDYKLLEGVPMLFEINARFGASLAYRINEYLAAYVEAVNAEAPQRQASMAAR